MIIYLDLTLGNTCSRNSDTTISKSILRMKCHLRI